MHRRPGLLRVFLVCGLKLGDSVCGLAITDQAQPQAVRKAGIVLCLQCLLHQCRRLGVATQRHVGATPAGSRPDHRCRLNTRRYGSNDADSLPGIAVCQINARQQFGYRAFALDCWNASKVLLGLFTLILAKVRQPVEHQQLRDGYRMKSIGTGSSNPLPASSAACVAAIAIAFGQEGLHIGTPWLAWRKRLQLSDIFGCIGESALVHGNANARDPSLDMLLLHLQCTIVGTKARRRSPCTWAIEPFWYMRFGRIGHQASARYRPRRSPP